MNPYLRQKVELVTLLTLELRLHYLSNMLREVSGLAVGFLAELVESE